MSLQSPDPPLVPCCDRWIELYRGESPFTGLPFIFYGCVCGEADVDLSVVLEGRSRRLVWGVVHQIVGVNRRELIESWERARESDLSGFEDVPVDARGHQAEPAVVDQASESRAVPQRFMGKAAREAAAEAAREQAAREPVFR